MNQRSFNSFLAPGEKILFDSHPIAKPGQWMPWGLVAIGVFAIVIAVKEAIEGRATFAPFALAFAAAGWPLYFLSRTRVILTDRALIHIAGGLAKVRRLPLEDTISIAMKGTRGRRGFLVEMTKGRWLRLAEFPAPEAFWQALPNDKKAPVSPQAAKRWDRLNWTITALWLPLLLPFLGIFSWTLMLYGEHAPIEARTVGTGLFLFVTFFGLAVSVLASWFVALWITLWLWRKAISPREATTLFLWDIDPDRKSLSSRLNGALLPFGLRILRRVYGQQVKLDIGR
ncbi:MAG: hypothetical protein AAF495_26055 [Pseudomonadota bacterium]